MRTEKEKRVQESEAVELELSEQDLADVVGGINVPRVPTHDYDDEVKEGI